MKPIPNLLFDTDVLLPERRFRVWSAALPHYDLALRHNAPAESFGTIVTAWYLGDIVMVRATLPAIHWIRRAERVQSDGVNTYNFLLLTHGSFAGQTADRPIMIGPGQIGCFDLAQPYEGDSEASDSLAITITRPALDRLLHTEPDLHGRTFTGGAGTLLVDYLLALERQLPNLDEQDIPSIVRATLGQFVATIDIAERRIRSSSPLDDLRHEVRRRIEQRLADRDLTPDDLAADLGVTRSMLYRCFRSLGGIAAYVRRRRLEAVRALLSDAREQRSIAELAQDFGFADASHLATAFRVAYGVTPREFRRARRSISLPDGSRLEPTALFQTWTSKLQGRSL